MAEDSDIENTLAVELADMERSRDMALTMLDEAGGGLAMMLVSVGLVTPGQQLSMGEMTALAGLFASDVQEIVQREDKTALTPLEMLATAVMQLNVQGRPLTQIVPQLRTAMARAQLHMSLDRNRRKGDAQPTPHGVAGPSGEAGQAERQDG